MTSNKFDDILSRLGTGKWNFYTLIVMSYWMMQVPSQILPGAFITPAVPHTCRPPPNATVIPQDNDTHTQEQCSYMVMGGNGSVEEHPCTEWDFDHSVYGDTLTEEFKLVCGRKFLRPLYNSMYFIGSFFGSPVNGWFADRYGRKLTLTIGSIVYTVLGNSINWLPDLTAILVVRFFSGLFHSACIQPGYSMVMETFEARYRSVAGIIIFMPWCVGMMVLGGVASVLPNWRWLTFTMSLPLLLFLPAAWFLDESPRWLIVRGRHSKALRVLQRAARWNKVSLPPERELRTLMQDIMIESRGHEVSKKGGFMSHLKTIVEQFSILVRTKRMRRITLCVYYLLLACGMGYYGLSLGGESFSTSPYIYIVMSGLMEVPGSTLTIPLVGRCGRRYPNVVLFFLTAAVLLSATFIPKRISWLMIALALVGKLTLSAAFQIVYLHLTELFPTEVRTRGMGTASMMSKLGSTISPFLVDSLRSVWGSAPSIVLGCTSLLAAFVTCLLPETKGAALHDTVAGLEASGYVRRRKYSAKDEVNSR